MTAALVATTNIAFIVVFGIFLVATAGLLVLTVQFIVAKGKKDKADFEAQRAEKQDASSPPS
jgi:hypothetical protein